MTSKEKKKAMVEEMEIEIVKFYPFPLRMKNATLLGVADIRLGGLLTIRGVKLLRKQNGGVFISMPSVEVKEGEYRELVKIEFRPLREKIRKTLSEFFKESNLF
jgi:DNA-binding cell septation regulator SpoVG